MTYGSVEKKWLAWWAIYAADISWPSRRPDDIPFLKHAERLVLPEVALNFMS